MRLTIGFFTINAIILVPHICQRASRAETIAVRPAVHGATHVAQVDGTWGWQFQVHSTIQITKVGVYDDFGSAAHTVPVGIWSAAGAGPFATVTVTPASVAEGPTLSGPGFNGVFRYESLTSPLVLAPGFYRIGADTNFDKFVFDAPVPSAGGSEITPQFPVLNGRNNGFSFPNEVFLGDLYGYYGPNFQYTVPEPASGALLLVGLTVIGANVRTCRRLAAFG